MFDDNKIYMHFNSGIFRKDKKLTGTMGFYN